MGLTCLSSADVFAGSQFWIGGAGQHGKVCTVFAQLTVAGKYEGPHVFVVRIRDDQGKVSKGELPPRIVYDVLAGTRLRLGALLHG